MADNSTNNYTGDDSNWTTNMATTTSGSSSSIDISTIKFAYFIVMGIIIPIGLICNSLSVAVFIRSKALRQSTTGLYLVSLAIADFLFLIGELLRWLGVKNYIPGYQFDIYSDASCQFIFSLRYAAKLTSAWITVVITAQRYVIVAFPLKAGTMCTRRHAYIGIASTYIACFIAGCYPILCVGIVPYNGAPLCGYNDPDLYNILSWVILRVGSLLLPGLIVLVLTTLICVILAKARIKRNRHLSESRSNKNKVSKTSTSSPGVDRQLTAMLLAVAITFLLLRLPYTIFFYLNDYKTRIWPDISPSAKYAIYVVYKISDLLASTNYALNFFLYCLTGTTFRTQFLWMLGCEKTAARNTTRGVTSSNGYQKGGTTDKAGYARQPGGESNKNDVRMKPYVEIDRSTLETTD